jgi:Domain of unknown function (DUF4760)
MPAPPVFTPVAYQMPSIDSTTQKIEYWTLRIGGAIAVVATVVLIAVAISQDPSSKSKVEIRDIAAVFTAIVVATTCVYHAMNLKLNLTANSLKLKLDADKWQYDIQQKAAEAASRAKTKEAEDLHAKRLLTMEKCLEWHRMAEKTGMARKFIARHKDLLNNSNVASFVAEIESEENSTTYRAAVISVMNYFENLAEGINSGMLDEDYVKNIFKTMFLKYLADLQPYFDMIEKRDGENGIYKSFKKVAERWK